MNPFARFVLIFAIAVMGLSAVGLLIGLTGTSDAQAMPALTQPPPIDTATATATVTPVFSATLLIQPARPAVRVGETLTVTVNIDVSEGCQYPIFELSLAQDSSEPPIFAHIDPPVDMITGPITLPSQWTFQATAPGLATFDAQTFGERYCGYWYWHYLYGRSGGVLVGDEIYQSWLPTIR